MNQGVRGEGQQFRRCLLSDPCVTDRFDLENARTWCGWMAVRTATTGPGNRNLLILMITLALLFIIFRLNCFFKRKILILLSPVVA